MHQDPSAPITVNYGITGGIEGGTTGTVTFATGAAVLTQMVNVTTNGDIIIEADEAISVVLDTPSANATILVGTGTSSFTDDDSASININSPTAVLEGDTGIATISFMVSIDASDPSAPITVNYGITGGIEGGTTGTVTFATGAAVLTQMVNVTTNGDIVVEADEAVSVVLKYAKCKCNYTSRNRNKFVYR